MSIFFYKLSDNKISCQAVFSLKCQHTALFLKFTRKFKFFPGFVFLA